MHRTLTSGHALFTDINGRPKMPDCCNDPRHADNPQCFPIEIPADDQFYGLYGQKCMNVIRSLPGVHHKCKLGESTSRVSLGVRGVNAGHGGHTGVIRGPRGHTGVVRGMGHTGGTRVTGSS